MFSFIRTLPAKRLYGEQLPLLMLSLGIAELFYKFHSFLLEASAFLLTWAALDALLQLCLARLRPQAASARRLP